MIDENDLQFITKKYGKPLFWQPAPMSIHKGRINKGLPKINPHLSRFFYKDEIVDVNHIKPIYYQSWTGEWRPLYEVCHGYGNHWATLKDDWQNKIHLRFIQWWMKRMDLIKGKILFPFPVTQRQLMYATISNFYPDPNPETTTVDGRAFQAVTDTWANLVAGAGTTAGDSDAATDAPVGNSEVAANTWGIIIRGFFLFDTSTIPDTDSITAADFVIDVNLKDDQNTSWDSASVIVSSAPASNTAIVAGDYDSRGTTAFSATKLLANVVVGSNTWAFNSTGLTNISKTGVSKFAFVWDDDRSNTTPPWEASKNNQINLDFADTADTTTDPKFVVTYAVAATSGKFASNIAMLKIG
ncbi:MAG: hypothetical protein A2W47_04570 [Gammaproteobacteria bacterium RIFCSPHIGHO2_12_38_15]|nr:MAG: hypothetical protein A2W47_04570 [Gammaproteobacteria bacterium RIFCSPHIGHO2_12_38_15]